LNFKYQRIVYLNSHYLKDRKVERTSKPRKQAVSGPNQSVKKKRVSAKCCTWPGFSYKEVGLFYAVYAPVTRGVALDTRIRNQGNPRHETSDVLYTELIENKSSITYG
jgi:hypothetical protein